MLLLAIGSIIFTTVVIFTHNVAGIPLEQFYPFGQGAKLSPNDDGSSVPILLKTPFPYFDGEKRTVFVNNNGAISFTAGISQYTPNPFGELNIKLIAPYWADVDTRGAGAVWYRECNDTELLARATEEIRRAFHDQGSFTTTYLFITTWDHVGYFQEKNDKTNTFQCVMATDGVNSFTIFLYADEEIQWTTGDASNGTNGTGGTPAQVGFNAGDGTRFITIPGSRTDAIINITQTSNVAIPGMWVYKVDEENIAGGGCTKGNEVSLTVLPRAGTVLGGTSVQVAGLCFAETDTISCVFDGEELEGFYITELLAGCVAPPLSTIGRVPFQLIVKSSNGVVRTQGEGEFISLPFDTDSMVEYNTVNINFHPGISTELTWPPESVAPLLDPNAFSVDVELYCLDEDTENWKQIAVLASDNPNSGQTSVTIPDIDRLACSMSIKVLVSGTVSTTAESLISIMKRLKSGIWSPVGYLSRPSRDLYSRCNDWISAQPGGIVKDLKDQVEPCPPTMAQAVADNRFDSENELTAGTFHSGLSCFRQVVLNRRDKPCLPGSQCCYGTNGNLLTGPPGGGTIALAAPQGPLKCYLEHFIKDVLPAIYCCTGPTPVCNTYYSYRPSQSEAGYVLPVPAMGSGDPHLVSLDGTPYTFNGRGEFVLMDTQDAVFTLQGRMVDAKDASGSFALATVFSAIVAKQDDSDTVQFEVSRRGLKARVNGQTVHFEGVTEQEFTNVTIRKNGDDNTLAARFSCGAYLETKVENGIIAVLSVSIPRSFRSSTSGLLGNYNGDPSDDLLPRGSTIFLSTSSSMEDIHNLFGVTWIINDPAESLFTYKAGQDFELFYDPDFTPAFEATFSDSVLENQASILCGEDRSCLYDIATTGRTDIGQSTLRATQDYEYQVTLSIPIVCDSPCVNGACVANDTCNCATDFEGPNCIDQVLTDCPQNPCESDGVCQFHAGSYVCTCAPDFIGTLCQNSTATDNTREDRIPVEVWIISGVAAVIAVLIIGVTILLCWFILWSRSRRAYKPYSQEMK